MDAYGVFWGGGEVGLLPGSKEAIERLVAAGKIIGILSNSTQLAEKEIEKLFVHGLLQGKHFHFFITSGSIAKEMFFGRRIAFPFSKQKVFSLRKPSSKVFEPSTYF